MESKKSLNPARTWAPVFLVFWKHLPLPVHQDQYDLWPK